MARFVDEDFEKDKFSKLPIGEYAMRCGKPTDVDRDGHLYTDKSGNPFFTVMLVCVAGPHKGEKEAWTISENWMRHLIIHFMRAVGMMNVKAIDPFFRENPRDDASWDMNRLLNNIEDTLVLLEVDKFTYTKGSNAGKTGRTIDFKPFLSKDKKPAKQPEWKDPTFNYMGHEPPTPPVGDGSDGVNLDPDLDLEEDEDFFTD